MRQHHEGGAQHGESVLIDGLSRNGVDDLAARRAHMRDMTMARQAAERRYARPGLPAGSAGPEDAMRLAMAQERAIAFRAELARIDAEHRRWLREHGVDVVERPTRRRTSVSSPQT